MKAQTKTKITNKTFQNEFVLKKAVSPYGNYHVNIAIGCRLSNDVLIIGKNAKFLIDGKLKKLDEFLRHFDGKGLNLKAPDDMQIEAFNFLHYQWEENFKSGNYEKKDTVYVAKTDNGNYVIFQSYPRRAVVLTSSGEIIENNEAYFGEARTIKTKQTSLKSVMQAVEDYERAIQEEKDKKEAEHQELIAEMYQRNKGWYVVELRCFETDLFRGGHKERYTQWKILAESQMDAYQKAIKAAEEKNFFWFDNPEKCQIDFIGIWTDKVEEMYA